MFQLQLPVFDNTKYICLNHREREEGEREREKSQRAEKDGSALSRHRPLAGRRQYWLATILRSAVCYVKIYKFGLGGVGKWKFNQPQDANGNHDGDTTRYDLRNRPLEVVRA